MMGEGVLPLPLCQHCGDAMSLDRRHAGRSPPSGWYLGVPPAVAGQRLTTARAPLATLPFRCAVGGGLSAGTLPAAAYEGLRGSRWPCLPSPLPGFVFRMAAPLVAMHCRPSTVSCLLAAGPAVCGRLN